LCAFRGKNKGSADIIRY